MAIPFDPAVHLKKGKSEVAQFRRITQRLHRTVQRDQVAQTTTTDLRDFLQVDRVVLYYFYQEWEGRVTFESLSDERYSILGSTGPDECFNGEYAALYLDGRVRAIANVETEAIAPCHRDFLRHLGVRANLVVPILTEKALRKKLWGLLVAHHCQRPRDWSAAEIERMEAGAEVLATTAAIRSFA